MSFEYTIHSWYLSKDIIKICDVKQNRCVACWKQIYSKAKAKRSHLTQQQYIPDAYRRHAWDEYRIILKFSSRICKSCLCNTNYDNCQYENVVEFNARKHRVTKSWIKWRQKRQDEIIAEKDKQIVYDCCIFSIKHE